MTKYILQNRNHRDGMRDRGKTTVLHAVFS